MQELNAEAAKTLLLGIHTPHIRSKMYPPRSAWTENNMPVLLNRRLSLLFLLLILIYWPASMRADVRFNNAIETAGLAHQQADLSGDFIDAVGSLAMMSGGAAAGDFDGDGWMDLYVTRINLPNQLFRNKGDGTFEEVGAAAGVDLHSASAGCVWADIDNDGDQDLYVLTFGTRNYLYINDGSGHFEEQAQARQVALEHDIDDHVATSAAFGDVDNDGDLDLLTTAWQTAFASSNNTQTRLFINDGQGYFTDNTANAGLTAPTSGFSPSFADVDLDGWQDILIAADFGSSRYYHNQGNGIFIEKTEAAGLGTDENGMGSDLLDIDNDGDLDWFVSSIFDDEECEGQASCRWGDSGNRLYLNDGFGLFEDATDTWGVRDGGWGWGASSLDFDNDGDVDLILANGMDVAGTTADDKFNAGILRLWQNNGGSMDDIATEAGVFAIGLTRGVVVFDYDKDGDLDFYVVHNNEQPFLFENISTDTGHWLRVRLIGTLSNRDGTGAIVRVTTDDGLVQTRFATNNSNYNSHNEPILHFGLGTATKVTELEVEWPASGWVQRFSNLEIDQELTIEEADQTVVTPPDDPPYRGLYWDRSRSGHGFELQRGGKYWYLLMYTYHPDNTPLWYIATGDYIDGVFNGLATQVDYDPERTPHQQVVTNTGGPIRIDFNAVSNANQNPCNDGVDRGNALSTAIFDFDLDGQQGQWCVEPFRFSAGTPESDFTGSWFNSEDPGWGLTVADQGSGAEESLAVILYYYDAGQQPRWAIGSVSGVETGSEVIVDMTQASGYCLNCAPAALQTTPVGSIRLKFKSPDNDLDAGNIVNIDVNFSGAPGGSWLRTETAIQLLSDPNQ